MWTQQQQKAKAKTPHAGSLIFADLSELGVCRIISRPSSTVEQAEDSAGCIWALKRIQEDNHSVREAERMIILRDHPLIVRLESVFWDRHAIYLQMPFCKLGNLRTWGEQIKV